MFDAELVVILTVIIFRDGGCSGGRQFSTVDLEAMGKVLCDVTLQYKNTMEDER